MLRALRFAQATCYYSAIMIETRRRYVNVERSATYIVSVSHDPSALARKHWLETSVVVTDETTLAPLSLPKHLSTYQIGDVERPFRELVLIDFDGDQEAALQHQMDTIFRRIYQYIERGH